MKRLVFLICLAFQALPSTSVALPGRLILALDGIAYRDMVALQAGVTSTNFLGSVTHRQAFDSSEGYFPVSRMISTFPSTSDVAWTDIFGNRPLPGYQRTYFSSAANSEISINGVTTSMEHERQMSWQVESGFVRSMAYIYSVHIYEYELNQLAKSFFKAGNHETNFYAYIRSSDDAQHMNRNIFDLLCKLDRQLQDLRARYKKRAGHDLQIVILSDHGHNHAGTGRRVDVRAFLEKAGYRISQSIKNRKDVVLPTAGIEDWVEIHNSPAETRTLVQLLTQLQGADLLAATVPDQTNRFLVLNGKGERATIAWNPAKNTFRYSSEPGDPLNYRPAVDALARRNLLDADGFAAADAWMDETMTNQYPLALERIVRGLTRVTLNPATILISLDNRYVNANWLVKTGSRLVSCTSTHGALDDLNSDGMLLSNFTPTPDTSSSRVAALFDDFPGRRNYRTGENGAEWITKKEQALIRLASASSNPDYRKLSSGDVFLRVWSPEFARLDSQSPLRVRIEKIPLFTSAQTVRGNHQPLTTPGLHLTFNRPVSIPGQLPSERIYACPPDLILEPQTEYQISGWIRDRQKDTRIFEFAFYTNPGGRPAAY